MLTVVGRLGSNNSDINPQKSYSHSRKKAREKLSRATECDDGGALKNLLPAEH